MKKEKDYILKEAKISGKPFYFEVYKIEPMDYHIKVYKGSEKSALISAVALYRTHTPDLKHAFIKAYRYFKKTNGKHGFADI